MSFQFWFIVLTAEKIRWIGLARDNLFHPCIMLRIRSANLNPINDKMIWTTTAMGKKLK